MVCTLLNFYCTTSCALCIGIIRSRMGHTARRALSEGGFSMNAYVDPDLCIGCTPVRRALPRRVPDGRHAGRGPARADPTGGGAAGCGRSQRLPGKRDPHRGVEGRPSTMLAAFSLYAKTPLGTVLWYNAECVIMQWRNTTMRLLVIDGNSIANRAFWHQAADHQGRTIHQRHLWLSEYPALPCLRSANPTRWRLPLT